jgi:hypothetical protein
MKTLLLSLLITLTPAISLAQQTDTATASKEPVNQTDVQGKRHGMWWQIVQARMGEPAYGTWGSYSHGRRWGTWYKFDTEGQVSAIEHYRNDALDGEAKYFQNGHLVMVGNFRGLNPDQAYDTIRVINPLTGQEVDRVVSTERGSMRHGIWRYYDVRTGRLNREEEYQVDELIARKDFVISHEDSTYYRQRIERLPHNQGAQAKPPAGKDFRYSDYR